MPDLDTIFMVEDDPLIQEVLSTTLSESGFAVQSFKSAEVFLEVHTAKMRGCLLVDIRLPQMDGIALIAALGDRATRLVSVAMSGFTRTPLVVEAMRVGAVDFLEKPFANPVLLRALRVAIQWASSGRAETRADAAAAARRVSLLTPRELSIFNEFATGASTKRVAHALSLSPKTVEAYRTRLLSKLDVDTPYALVRLAVLNSLFGAQERERAADWEP
jgi:two-component system response regulator FixJ